MQKSSILLTAFVVMFAASSVWAATPNATSIKNLKAAFIGETNASAKYAAFAKKAREEGYANVALLFQAASEAEKIHANNHGAALEQLGDKAPPVEPKVDVKSTKENLEEAIKGESYEVSTMYPAFLQDANSENVSIALLSFNYAYRTEQRHKAMYESALKALTEKKADTLPAQYAVCMTCGNTYDNTAPSRCGLCMTSKERFITIK